MRGNEKRKRERENIEGGKGRENNWRGKRENMKRGGEEK